MYSPKEQLLELVRCGLWGNEPNTSLFTNSKGQERLKGQETTAEQEGVTAEQEGVTAEQEVIEWGEVVKLAREQTVTGVVGVAIFMLPQQMQPNRTLRLKVQQITSLNRAYHAHHIEVLGKLLDIIRRAGVERPVLLKGVGVAMYYPEPSLRQCGDIDVYVGEEHYLKCIEFIGAEIGVEIDIKRGSELHANFSFLDTEIEIHKQAIPLSVVRHNKKEIAKWSKEHLEGDKLLKVELSGIEVYLPPHTFNYIFLFLHMWRHATFGGVGLRQLCDWCCFIDKNRDEIDKEMVERVISMLKLEDELKTFTTICVDKLGLRHEFIPNYSHETDNRAVDRVFDYIMEGGNFGHKRKMNVPISQLRVEKYIRLIKFDPRLAVKSILRYIRKKLSV